MVILRFRRMFGENQWHGTPKPVTRNSIKAVHIKFPDGTVERTPVISRDIENYHRSYNAVTKVRSYDLIAIIDHHGTQLEMSLSNNIACMKVVDIEWN